MFFLLTAFADACEEKGCGHLSPSFLPAQFACEETMTQKTNGPISNDGNDFTANDFSIRFIKLSLNEGIALGHKNQRQKLDPETQIKAALTSEYYRQTPEK